eukprot:31905_1
MNSSEPKLFNLCDQYELYNALQFPYNVWIIDIQSADDYSNSHLATSINLPFNTHLSDDEIIDILDLNMAKYSNIQKIYMYSNDIDNANVWMYFIRLKKIIFDSCIHNKAIKDESYVLSINYDVFQSQFPFLCHKTEVGSISNSDSDAYDGYLSDCDLWNDHFGDRDVGNRTSEIDTYFDQSTSYPHVILNNKLYLGDIDHASNKQILCDLGITHVVNCTSQFDNAFETSDIGIQYLKLSVNDTDQDDISQHFERVIRFIDTALNHDVNKVLIHCFAGISRSSTIAIAYLMKTMHLNYSDARSFVQRKRNVIHPNVAFVQQLKDYEKTLFK